MTTRANARILPMKTAGTQHLIERTYREGGTFQWVRETYTNAIEAGATRVEFGVEWQGVTANGVYRRLIADNGKGMTADELVAFFNTFGGGGKPIGGMHENYGVGAKTSLLPWNRFGVIVISWVDGEPSMIWMEREESSGEYGLRVEEAEDPDSEDVFLEAVYEPYYDPELEIDWAEVKPDWIDDHGTVVILMGNTSDDDTVLGDPGRPEADIKGISAYLNRRIWDPANFEIFVDEFHSQDRSKWPVKMVRSGQKRMQQRRIYGARYFIEYPEVKFKSGAVSASATQTLADGTRVDWFLWDGKRPAVQSYAAISGFIGAIYNNELYDVTNHHSTYRMFGVTESAVRQNLWLIIRPPLAEEDAEFGVYPNSSRHALLVKGGLHAGDRLPIADWAAEFADAMPDDIFEAIKKARVGAHGTLGDEAWRERLAERFGSRWRIPKLRKRRGGPDSVDPQQLGSEPRRVRVTKKKRRGGQQSTPPKSGMSGTRTVGTETGKVDAQLVSVAGGIPQYRIAPGDDFVSGYLAAWQPNDPEYPEGVVLVNGDHPVIREEVEHWQSQYPDHHSEGIQDEVLKAYGEVAVAKVAHSEHLKGVLPSHIVEEDLRSDGALTMSLLGLIGEEAVIAPRLGRFGRRRANEKDAS